MRTIQAVVFDMDGVILDTERICRRTWFLAGKRYGLDDDTVEAGFRATIGCNKNDTRILIHRIYGASFPVEKFMEETSSFFHEIEHDEGIPLMKGVRETLDYLNSNGYRIALASSTRRPVVERQLTQAGVIGYFETITTGDTVVHSKPDPDIYIAACRSLSLDPPDCAAVEDSPNGIRSASSAGLKCIMIPDQVQPDREIRGLLWKLCLCMDDLKTVF
jgi:HAD superfamily hydrolase (TIGR01509 family)